MSLLIKNATVFDGSAFVNGLSLRVNRGIITEVWNELKSMPGEEVLDLQEDYLLPGFVDVHIHAFHGADTMQGEAAVRSMSRELRKIGIAAFCPTTMSASIEDTQRAIDGIRAVMDSPEPKGAHVLGVHMEAPFLNMGMAGAQRKAFLMNPEWNAFLRMTSGHLNAVRIVTLAPELEGSKAFIRQAVAAGIHVSIGHTDASAEIVHKAADWGAKHVTHTFNAQSALHHRLPGVPGAVLTDDRFYCEVICDGVHLHSDIIRLISRCKGTRAIAVTDAMEAAGMPDGEYTLGGQKVFVQDRQARLSNGRLAGSVLTMPQALDNLIHVFKLESAVACAMCTSSPASSLDDLLYGRIAPGSPTPLTRWSRDWHLMQVIDD